MTVKLEIDAGAIELAESVCRWSRNLLDKAPLTDEQREDMKAIHIASKDFATYASSQAEVIYDAIDQETKRRVRHQLRNYVNIIVGFSRLLVKELPDNLLMDMVTVRKIHDTGEFLKVQVDAIQ